MISTFIQNYEDTSQLATQASVVLGLLRTRIAAGTITRLDVYSGGNLTGTAVFNLRVNGTAQFTGEERPTITPDTNQATKDNLSIEIERGDRITLDLDNNPHTANLFPVTLMIDVDDGSTLPDGDLNADTNTLEKISGIAVAEFLKFFLMSKLQSGAQVEVSYNEDIQRFIFDSPNFAFLINALGGGTEGQLLAKLSDGGFEYEWVDAPEGGDDGDDGASAYEIAVANGYDGDVATWLATLHGADGDDGQDGADGINGTNGVGVPTGGTTGKVLAKKTSADYDTEWITPGYSLPLQTGNAGKVLGTNGTSDSWVSLPFDFVVAASDETTSITTGNAKVTFRAPVAFRLTNIKASLTTASSSGLPTFRVNKNGTTIFSTNLSINASATTSVGATTPFAFASGASYIDFAADDVITIDVTVAGTGAKGAKIAFIGLRN